MGGGQQNRVKPKILPPEKKIFQSEAEIIQICSNKQGLKKKITMSITN